MGIFRGGTESDTFIFDDAYSLSGSIDGNVGSNQITGPGVDTTWNITGVNQGSFLPQGLSKAISFMNIGSITGGEDGDNRVTVSGSSSIWTITKDNGGTLSVDSSPITLEKIQAFVAGSEGGSFTFNGPYSLSGGIDGGGGPSVLNGPPGGATWNLSTLTSGSMTPTDKAATNYQNINVLAGGGGGDTYNLYPGVTTPDVQVGSGIIPSLLWGVGHKRFLLI